MIGEEIAETNLHGPGPVLDRLASDPVRYATWYSYKPFLLFDWDIRIGKGGIYTTQFHNSPLDRGPMLAITALQVGLNPLLFALAFCGIVMGFVRGGAERMVAIAVVYLTTVHVVLQAEPRYAIPYRSLEIMLAVGALAYLWPQLRQKRFANGRPAAAG
jgi:hypothetical protein